VADEEAPHTTHGSPLTEPKPQPGEPAAPAGGLTDALTLWRSEMASAGPAILSAIRLDANERLVIPFTTAMVRAQVHYIPSPAARGYVHCNGKGCLLCRLERQVETRDLLPVYDAVDKVVGVLPISPSMRPPALRPQVKLVLEQLQTQGRLLVGVRKPDNMSFVVTPYDLPENADDGATVILAFTEQFKAGRIDLGCVYSRMTNEELAAVPEIATMMTLKGIKLS
jgi:hypothetical protein